MYTLTLTQGERATFDWVGDRYATGNEVSSLLSECLNGDQAWADDGDITFDVPEHVAWAIADLSEQEGGYWPCFSEELLCKMHDFVDNIV